MKSKWLFPVALIILLTGCLSWKEYSPADGKFSVLMPGTPKEVKQSVDTPLGPMSMNMLMLDLKDKEIVYMMLYIEYPEAAMQEVNSNVDKAFESARAGVERSSRGGRILSDTPTTLMNKYPGRELQIEMPDGKHAMRYRMNLVNNRVYLIGVATNADSLYSKEAVKYMDSFKLRENQDPR